MDKDVKIAKLNVAANIVLSMIDVEDPGTLLKEVAKEAQKFLIDSLKEKE